MAGQWRRFYFASALSLAMLAQPIAQAACNDEMLSVDRVSTSDGFALYAENKHGYPLTVSVRARPPRQYRSAGERITVTLEGHERRDISTLIADSKATRDVSVSCRWTVGRRDASHDDEHLYTLPYAPGMSYRVLQGYGSRFSHTGNEQYAIDFKMKVGTPVHAARGGVVAHVEESNDRGCWETGCGQFANFIVVLHDDGTTGEYYHLQQDGAHVSEGDRVVAGQLIGSSGNTGHTTLPHLHFAVYRPTDRARSQSIPVSFLSAAGVIHRPRRGGLYLAVVQSDDKDWID